MHDSRGFSLESTNFEESNSDQIWGIEYQLLEFQIQQIIQSRPCLFANTRGRSQEIDLADLEKISVRRCTVILRRSLINSEMDKLRHQIKFTELKSIAGDLGK